jgi:hypothetical protein
VATIGDSSAPSSNTEYMDALLTTTLKAYKKTMYDNIFKDSAFLAYLRMTSAVEKQDGGERVALPLMYGKNQTVGVHSGYETIDTTPQDGFTTAFYEWAEIAGSISISRKEQRQNSGEGRLLNLLEQKTKQAEMSMREELNEGLILGKVSSATFVPKTSLNGANGLFPLGYFLRKLCATDPIAGGNVGNISGASYDWWRHNTADASSGSAPAGGKFGLSVSTYAGLLVALKRMYNYCSRGSGGAPDLVVMDQVSYETYENAMDVKVRYTNTKMADMGFDNVKLRGATVIWDEQTPDVENGTAAITTGSAFYLNTNFYKLMIDSQTDIVTTPFIEPENQTAKTAKILFMGQAGVSNMRKHGLLFGIPQDTVA